MLGEIDKIIFYCVMFQSENENEKDIDELIELRALVNGSRCINAITRVIKSKDLR